VDLSAFVAALDRLTADDIRLVAKSLDTDSLADEVDWWRATIAIDRAVRHARVTRHAARAAARAAEVVQARATQAGVPLPDDDVTRVARAAAEIARGLTAGPATQPMVRLLCEPWAVVVPVV
jgi:hypothetical protein